MSLASLAKFIYDHEQSFGLSVITKPWLVIVIGTREPYLGIAHGEAEFNEEKEGWHEDKAGRE